MQLKVPYGVTVFFNCFFYSLFLVDCLTFWHGLSYFSLNHSSQFYVFIDLPSISNYVYHSHFLGQEERGDKQKFLWQTFLQLPFLARSWNPFTVFQGFSHCGGWLFPSAPFCIPPASSLHSPLSSTSGKSHLPDSYPNSSQKRCCHTVPFVWLLNSFARTCTKSRLNLRYVSTQVRLVSLLV